MLAALPHTVYVYTAALANCHLLGHLIPLFIDANTTLIFPHDPQTVTRTAIEARATIEYSDLICEKVVFRI